MLKKIFKLKHSTAIVIFMTGSFSKQRKYMKINIIICGLFALLLSSNVHSEDIKLCRDGWNFHLQGQYEKAILSFHKCIEKGQLSSATLARTYRNIGIVHNKNNNSKKALGLYDKAIDLKPKDPWFDYVNKGNAYSALSQFDNAIKSYNLALSVYPNFNEAYYNLGIVYGKQGKDDLAKNQFIKAYEHGLNSDGLFDMLEHYQIDVSKFSIFQNISTKLELPVFKPIDTIHNVLDEEQQTCGAFVSRGFIQHENSDEIIKSKSYTFENHNITFNIPDVHLPKTHLRIHLNDTSRGVKDDYLLISGGSLEPVKAAVVITELPAHIQENEQIFMLTRKLEGGLSRNIESQSILMRELSNATYGNVLELLVNNRIGSFCFPTSEFMQSNKTTQAWVLVDLLPKRI